MVVEGYLKWRSGFPIGLTPHVGQLVLPYIPVEGWVTDSNKHGLLHSPSNNMCFPAHNRKAVHIDGMSFKLAVLVDSGGGSMVLACPLRSFLIPQYILPRSLPGCILTGMLPHFFEQ